MTKVTDVEGSGKSYTSLAWQSPSKVVVLQFFYGLCEVFGSETLPSPQEIDSPSLSSSQAEDRTMATLGDYLSAPLPGERTAYP